MHDQALPLLRSSYEKGFRHPSLLRLLAENNFYRADFVTVFWLESMILLMYFRFGALSRVLLRKWLSASRLFALDVLFGTYRKTKILIRRIFRRPPILPKQHHSPEVMSLLGDGLLDRGLYSVAERNFRIALKSNPGSANEIQKLGISLWFQGRRDEALPLLKRACELEPNSEAFRWNLNQFEAGVHPRRIIKKF